MTELGEVIRDAVQGRAGRDALAALLTAVRGYVSAHPGRYLATTGAELTGPDDPLGRRPRRELRVDDRLHRPRPAIGVS